MAFKQGNNPLSRKASPMRMSPFNQQRQGMTMAELEKATAKQEAASKAQANELPQIEKPGFDYEMDQDMSYPGGERGRDYDEEGTKDGMSRESSPLNILGPEAQKLAKNNSGKKNAKASKIPRKSISVASTLKSEKKADVKVDKKDIDTKLLTKNKPRVKTAKDAGKVDTSGRDGSNKQERKKRRAERKSIRKDKTLSSSQKKMAKKESRQKQKENVRGVKK